MNDGIYGRGMTMKIRHAQVGFLLLCVATFAACAPTQPEQRETPPMTGKMRQLTPEEERVIVHKGTEPPFSGQYDKSTAMGTYVCRRCDVALYRSDEKFDAGCGWPSFDAEVPGAVKRTPDADGRRTEITCAACNAHLGHVFTGEKLTPRDTRHCVNSISLGFVPRASETNRFGRAVFAGGCFWGVEYYLQREPGVIRTLVGYTGGTVESPTYEQVCRHTTGHAEAVEVIFDPQRTRFETLARLFLEIHDPTEVDRQGPDIGAQYRSVIFYTDEDQRQTAEKLLALLRARGLAVATRVEPAARFWPAEPKHRDYYLRNGKTPYCHARVKRF
jgi:peptide methionine sulfoxide reductase msrA/msrB